MLALACEEREEQAATGTPSPAAATVTTQATPTPEATPRPEATPASWGEISDEELALMVLPQEELGQEYADFELDETESGYRSNEDVAAEDFDPDEEAQDIERFGRVGGYEASYSRWSLLAAPAWTVLSVDLFEDSDGASGYVADTLADFQAQLGQEQEEWAGLEEFTRLDVEKIGDETEAFRVKATFEDEGGIQYTLCVTAVVFRKGRILGAVGVAREDDQDIVSQVVALARKLDERIEAVLRGDITVMPGPSPAPRVRACPDSGTTFCAFTARVEQALASQDADFLAASSLTQSVLCTAHVANLGHVCGPEQIGETITGVPYDRESSKGALMPLEDYRNLWAQLFGSDLPAEEDGEGSGELRIWGLAYPVAPAAGAPRFLVVTYMSDTGRGPERQAISLHCELVDGQWGIKGFVEHDLALALPQEPLGEWRDWPE